MCVVDMISRLALVMVGGQPCTDVTHNATIPQQQLTCVLPAGSALEAAVIVIQNGGEVSRSAAYVSYQNCPAGQYSVPGRGTTCYTCSAGTYSTIPGVTACLDCPAGRARNPDSETTGLSCNECDAGA